MNNFAVDQNSFYGIKPYSKPKGTRVKKSVILALVILVALLSYFGVRSMLREDGADASLTKGARTIAEAGTGKTGDIPEIVTRHLVAEPHPVFLSLKGRTAPNRTVTVSAATTGIVVAAPNLEGRAVREGAVLCRLDVEARQARIAEAEALVAAQRADYNAQNTLAQKGLASINRASSAKATLEAAEAALNAARIEMSRTVIAAPFSGIFETRIAERGDFLSPGEACGVITDLNPIRVEAEVTEEFATALALDAPVTIRVLGEAPREGQISYVARTANDATRTFKIEASLENANNEIPAGLTSDLRIGLGETLATPITPALLTLDDAGRVGVRYVNTDSVVTFAPVTIIDDSNSGIWVTGLPERVDVVSVGQEYISEGAKVRAVPEAGFAQ